MRIQIITSMALSVMLAGLPAPGFAQEAAQIIKERQDRMEAVGDAAEIGGDMARGRRPFDAAAAAEVFRVMNQSATGFADLFPAGTETGGDTRAAPAVFERPEEFRAAVEKFEADTAAASQAAPQTPEAFQTAFGDVSQNCRSCHETFRVRRN